MLNRASAQEANIQHPSVEVRNFPSPHPAQCSNILGRSLSLLQPCTAGDGCEYMCGTKARLTFNPSCDVCAWKNRPKSTTLNKFYRKSLKIQEPFSNLSYSGFMFVGHSFPICVRTLELFHPRYEVAKARYSQRSQYPVVCDLGCFWALQICGSWQSSQA